MIKGDRDNGAHVVNRRFAPYGNLPIAIINAATNAICAQDLFLLLNKNPE